nr:MAG TPA: CUE domain protein [Caudoviricetes sp.]
MNDTQWQEHFKALDFSMKCQGQLLYQAVKRALVEVVQEMFPQTPNH